MSSGGPYDVAIHLTATDGVSGVLAGIAKSVLGLSGSVGQLQKDFNALRLGVIGAASVAAGLEGFKILKDLSVYAKDLSHELVQIQKLGISADQLTQVRAAAQRTTSQVPGTTETGALELYGVTYSMFGHEKSIAESLMKPLAEFVQVLGNQTGDYEAAQANIVKMVRAGDLMGQFINDQTRQIDVEKLTRFLDLGAKVIAATHGMVNASTWFNLAQTGGPSLMNMSEQGLMSMAIASQAMGGYRAGTALMSMFQQFIGGVVTPWRAENLHELGLVGDYKVTKGGHILWAQGALDTPFVQSLTTDPMQATKTLMEHMDAHGISDVNAQIKELFQLLQRSTSTREIADFLKNFSQIVQEKDRIENALGVGGAVSLQNAEDLMQVEKNLGASWKNLMFAIAGPGTGFYISSLQTVTDAVNAFTGAMRGVNPQIIKNWFEAFGLISASLVGAGTLAILTAIGTALGPAGVIIGGLTTLAVVLGALKGAFSGVDLDNLDRFNRGAAVAPEDFWASTKRMLTRPVSLSDMVEAPAYVANWLNAQSEALGVSIRKAYLDWAHGLQAAFYAGPDMSLLDRFDRGHAVAGAGGWFGPQGEISQQARTAMTEVGNEIDAAIAAIPNQVAGEIQAMGAALGDFLREMIDQVRAALGLPADFATRKPLPEDVNRAVDAAYTRRSQSYLEPSIKARLQELGTRPGPPMELPSARLQTPAGVAGMPSASSGSLSVQSVAKMETPIVVEITGDLRNLISAIVNKVEAEVRTFASFGGGHDGAAIPAGPAGIGHQ